MLPVAIVGSGFAASVVARILRSNGISFEVLEASESAPNPRFGFTDQNSDLGQQDPFSRTRGLYGGLDVWGGAVSFGDHTDLGPHVLEAEDLDIDELTFLRTNSWHSTASRLLKVPAGGRFAKLVSALGKTGALRRQHGRIDVSRYSERAKMNLGSPEKVVITGLRKVENVSLELHYEVDLHGGDEDRRQKTRRYSAVFLCSGPYLNAFFAALLTGQTQFSFGDHLSFVSGKIDFIRPVFPGSAGVIQRPGYLFSSYTFGIPCSPFQATASLRFSPLFKAKGFADLPHDKAALRKVGLGKEYLMHWLLDYPITDQNSLKFEMNSGSQVGARFNFTVDWELVQRFRESLAQSTEAIMEAGAKHLPNPLMVSSIFDFLTRSGWTSALHPYGTVPVDETFELPGAPGFFVLGSSSFRTGSLEHPTISVISTAARAAIYYSRKVS